MARRSSSRKRRVRRKQLGRAQRKANAAKWLAGTSVCSLVESYCRRYAVSEADAYIELLELGYQDELRVEYFEKEGIPWKYMVWPQSGDMVVVPEDTEPWELYPWYHSG